MLELPNVTLIAVTSVKIRKTIKALQYSMKGVNFAETVLVSHKKPLFLDPRIMFKPIEKLTNIDQFSYAMVYKLHEYVKTDFALLVHYDGFVVNPESWRDEFLNYDYVGSPWPDPHDDFTYRDINGELCRVGNSVSIRSKQLMELPSKINMPWEADHGFFNEDGFICVKNKHIFEQHGMHIAPIDVAKYFGHEKMIPEIAGIRPFVFHKWWGTNSEYPKF